MQLSEEQLVERALDELAGNPIGTRNIVETSVRIVLNALAEHKRAQADARPAGHIPYTRKAMHDGWTRFELRTEYADEAARRLRYAHPEASAPGLSDEEIKAGAHRLWLLEGQGLSKLEHYEAELRAILARASAGTVAEPSVPNGWRERLQEMRDAAYTYSQYPELAHTIFDSVIDALGELEDVQKQEFCANGQQAFETALRQYAEACHRSESCSAMDSARARVCAIFSRAAQQQAEPVKVYPQGVMGIPPYDPRATGSHQATQGLTWNAQQAEPGADELEEAGSLIGDGFVLEFERWNDVTGALPRNGSWLAEVSDIIQRAAQSGQRAGVAEDVAMLRNALAPFAGLADQELSWACVRYSLKHDPEHQSFQRPQMQRAFNRAREAWLATAAPTQQQEGGKE